MPLFIAADARHYAMPLPLMMLAAILRFAYERFRYDGYAITLRAMFTRFSMLIFSLRLRFDTTLLMPC